MQPNLESKNEEFNSLIFDTKHRDDRVDFSPFPLVGEYTRYFDESINRGLRTGRMSERSYGIYKQMIDALNSTTSAGGERIFYRGVVSTDEFPIKNMKVGDEIRDPGFVSKSSNPYAALNFVDQFCCFLILRYPDGIKHLPIHKVSHFLGEFETIGYPGERFVITDINTSYSRIKMFLLDFIGYEDVSFEVDKSIDDGWPMFRFNLGRGPWYFPKRRLLMGDTDRMPLVPYVKYFDMMGKSAQSIDDRLYTLYASGDAEGVVKLPNYVSRDKLLELTSR